MIRYEMSLELNIVTRVIYSALDLLGDIGGFREGLFLILGSVIFVIRFQPLNMMLVERLFIFQE